MKPDFRLYRLLVLSGVWWVLWLPVAPLLAEPVQTQADGAVPLAEPVDFDRWYSVLLQDQPVGYSRITMQQEADRITTRSATRLTISRGGVDMSLAFRTRFVETIDGKPIEAASHQQLGAMTVQQTMTFADGQVELVTEQVGQKQTQVVPLPRVDWLPPAAASRYAEAQFRQGAQEMRFRTMDPSAGPRVIELTWKVVGPENVDVLGKIVPATACDVTVSILPGVVTRQYVDEQGQMLRSTVTLLPGMTLDMVEADEQIARAKISPPELLVQTLVRPEGQVQQPRASRSAVYQLTINPEGDMAVEHLLPRAGYQRVVWADDRTARVVVDLDEPVNPLDDLPTAEHRRASMALNSDDEVIRELARKALSEPADLNEADPARKAEALRRFVHDFIEEKDLSVGFATASEVARTAQGDCTEHAVLLAAMLRVVDIPSRTVTGLIYVDEFAGQRGVFGYHMWTQAWLVGEDGGRWIDLDPTLPDAPYDAAHIALTTSAMADAAMMNDMMQMVPLFGRMTIRVVQVNGQGGDL